MVDGGFLFQNRKVSGWQHEKCLAEKWFPKSKITKATSEMFTSLKLFSYIPLGFTVLGLVSSLYLVWTGPCKTCLFKKEIVAIFPFSFNTILNRLDNYCNQCLQFPNYSQVWKTSTMFLKLQNVYFHKRSFSFLSIRKSKLLWVKNPLATHHHLPRPIQIQGMPVECYAVKKKHKMLERQYIEISTGQSASPSLERLPSSSPTTQPSQWWGTSMKYLQLDWVTTTLCLHRVIISY